MGYWLIIVILVPFVAIAGWFFELARERAARRRYPPPGTLVDVGGFRLHLYCRGERRPGQATVVLESGHGLWSLAWNPVMDEIARFARVCAYDRAGFGWSERSPRGRAPQEVAAELHTLLTNAGESGPYVLVGHSLGGVFIRQYYSQFPDEVAGMVFIDILPDKLAEYLPTYYQMLRRSLRSMRLVALLANFGLIRLMVPRRFRGQPSYLLPQDRAVFAAQSVSSTYMDSLYEETAAAGRVVPRTGTVAHLENRPLVVIKAHYPESRPPTAHGYTDESWKQLLQAWPILQKELSDLSSCSQYIEASSGHGDVIAKQPEVVVKAVRWVVDNAQKEQGRGGEVPRRGSRPI
jgi:pimeloyl-ACP methyl ester carboxylesterase